MINNHRQLIIALLSALTVALTPMSLEARESFPLNNNWRTYATSDGSADNALYVSLPYCMDNSAKLPVSQATMDYLRQIHAPQEWESKRVFLKFHGVQSVAELLVNGRYVGEHRGGSTAFVFEITDFVKLGSNNNIALRVNAIPRSDMLPTSIEHELYCGIHRDVELIITPKTAFSPDVYGADGIFVSTTSTSNNVVKGSVQLHFTSREIEEMAERTISLKIYDKNGKEQFSKNVSHITIDDSTPLDIPFEIRNAELWSPSNPTLYTVVAEMNSSEKGNKAQANAHDRISTTTGFRTIEIASDGGFKGCVSINNITHLFRGVSYMHDNPWMGGVITTDIFENDIAQIKDLGANALRSAIGPHDKALYSLCDNEGIMAWVDTPLARSRALSDIGYFPTEEFEENGIQQLKEIIYQNYNHPSIMMWGLFSLIKPSVPEVVEYITQLNEIAKEIDPSRPTVAISCTNGDINNIPDLIVWQQDLGWSRGLHSDIAVWQKQLHDKWRVFRSGVAYGVNGLVSHQDDRDEVTRRKTDMELTDSWIPEVRQSVFHEEYAKELVGDSLFWGMWINTLYEYRSPRSDNGIKNFGFNNEGLITFNRQVKKDAYYLYRALWNTEEQTLYITDRRNRLVANNEISIRVYASPNVSGAPKLYIHGDSIAMEEVAPAQYIANNIRITDSTPIVVKHGALQDSITLIYGSPLRALDY